MVLLQVVEMEIEKETAVVVATQNALQSAADKMLAMEHQFEARLKEQVSLCGQMLGCSSLRKCRIAEVVGGYQVERAEWKLDRKIELLERSHQAQLEDLQAALVQDMSDTSVAADDLSFA